MLQASRLLPTRKKADAIHFRAAACWVTGQRFSSTSSTSPVSELRHRLSSRQYPGAQPGPNVMAEGAAGAALTTSPVELFKQSDPISQYPSGHRGLAGSCDWAVAIENQHMTMPIVANARLVELLCMTFSMVGGVSRLGLEDEIADVSLTVACWVARWLVARPTDHAASIQQEANVCSSNSGQFHGPWRSSGQVAPRGNNHA